MNLAKQSALDGDLDSYFQAGAPEAQAAAVEALEPTMVEPVVEATEVAAGAAE